MVKKDEAIKCLGEVFPNFFCNMEVLNALLDKESDWDDYGEIDFTIDVIDAPYTIFYKAAEKVATVKVYKRGEVYTHDASGHCIGTATLDKISGGISMDFKNSLKPDKMGMFVVACLKLNEYIQENNLAGMYDGLDLGRAGILITRKEGKFACKVVVGKERPAIMCDTTLNGLQMCRPYIDEENDDSPLAVFRDWVKKEEQYGRFVIHNDWDNGNVTIRCVVTGTHHRGRADRIEYVAVGDLLTLKREFDSPLMPDSIEVFNTSDESLGWIEVYMSDILAPLMDDKIMTISEVTVASVIPKSQRGKRARAAELFIDVTVNINKVKINRIQNNKPGLSKKDTDLKVLKDFNDLEQPTISSEQLAGIDKRFKRATKEELIERALDSARKIIESFRGDNQGKEVSLRLLVFGAKLGLAGDGVLNEEEREFVERVFGTIVDGDISDIYDRIGNEIDDSDYELVRVLTKKGNNVVMPFLHFILSFAYIDHKMEEEVAKRLEVLFGLNVFAEVIQDDQEGDSLSKLQHAQLSADDSLPVSKDESMEGYKVVKENETITVNDDFRITLQKGMYYATPEHVQLDEKAILNIGRLKEEKQDVEGYIQVNASQDADFVGTFFAKEFESGQYEQILEKFDFENYLRDKALQQPNQTEEQINEWATEICVKTDFYSTYKVYKNEEDLKIGCYSSLIDGIPTYMIQVITRKALYMCNAVFTMGVLAIGMREFEDRVSDDQEFLDGLLNSITLMNIDSTTVDHARLEGGTASEARVQEQLDKLIKETTDTLHEIDTMWSDGKLGLQQQWLNKTYTFGLEVHMDAVVVKKMIDTYAPLYENLLEAYDESAELLWEMLTSNTSQLMCAEKSLEMVEKHYKGMDSLRYDFEQSELLNESIRSVSYTRSSDSVKEKWEKRRDEARWKNQAEKMKVEKEQEIQSRSEEIDDYKRRQKIDLINTREEERKLLEVKKNRNKESLRLHRLELDSLSSMHILRKISLEKMIREEEMQDKDFDVEMKANQIRLKDELKALDWQIEERKRDLIKELDEKYQIPKRP